jgi:hypothetical protein
MRDFGPDQVRVRSEMPDAPDTRFSCAKPILRLDDDGDSSLQLADRAGPGGDQPPD